MLEDLRLHYSSAGMIVGLDPFKEAQQQLSLYWKERYPQPFLDITPHSTSHLKGGAAQCALKADKLQKLWTTEQEQTPNLGDLTIGQGHDSLTVMLYKAGLRFLY